MEPVVILTLKKDEAVAFFLAIFSFLIGVSVVLEHAPTWKSLIYLLGGPAIYYLAVSIAAERVVGDEG